MSLNGIIPKGKDRKRTSPTMASMNAQSWAGPHEAYLGSPKKQKRIHSTSNDPSQFRDEGRSESLYVGTGTSLVATASRIPSTQTQPFGTASNALMGPCFNDTSVRNDFDASAKMSHPFAAPNGPYQSSFASNARSSMEYPMRSTPPEQARRFSSSHLPVDHNEQMHALRQLQQQREYGSFLNSTFLGHNVSNPSSVFNIQKSASACQLMAPGACGSRIDARHAGLPVMSYGCTNQETRNAFNNPSANAADFSRTTSAQELMQSSHFGQRFQRDPSSQPFPAQSLDHVQALQFFLLQQQQKQAPVQDTARAMQVRQPHRPRLPDSGASRRGSDMRAIQDLLAMRGIQGVLSQVSRDHESRAMLDALMQENRSVPLQPLTPMAPFRPDGVPLHLPASLAHPDDEHSLSGHQLFLRRQVEVFEATAHDIGSHKRGRNKTIAIGQVGVRCRHCAHVPMSQQQRGSVYFPSSVYGIYQATQNMSSTHLQCGLCSEMPESTRQQFVDLLITKNTSSIVGRNYWAQSAKSMGLVDTEVGIFFIRTLPSGLQIINKDEVGGK